MRTLGNAPLLLLLTSAIASCSDSSVLLRAEDDSGSEAGLSTDATADVAPPGHDAATRDDAGDGAVTAADTGALDTGGDAVVDAQAGDGGCPPGYNPSGPDGGCTPTTIRRPFLVGSSLRSAPSVARGDWVVEVPPTTQPLPALTAQKLARTWLKDGLEEHASVAAFARFTMHLLSVGAPPELLVEAQRASLDEIRHAKICFALARRYGMTVTGPGNLSLRDALPDASLAEIVALAAEEGCVGETLGAALAREQLAVAKDPHVAEALRKILATRPDMPSCRGGFSVGPSFEAAMQSGASPRTTSRRPSKPLWRWRSRAMTGSTSTNGMRTAGSRAPSRVRSPTSRSGRSCDRVCRPR